MLTVSDMTKSAPFYRKVEITMRLGGNNKSVFFLFSLLLTYLVLLSALGNVWGWRSPPLQQATLDTKVPRHALPWECSQLLRLHLHAQLALVGARLLMDVRVWGMRATQILPSSITSCLRGSASSSLPWVSSNWARPDQADRGMWAIQVLPVPTNRLSHQGSASSIGCPVRAASRKIAWRTEQQDAVRRLDTYPARTLPRQICLACDRWARLETEDRVNKELGLGQFGDHILAFSSCFSLLFLLATRLFIRPQSGKINTECRNFRWHDTMMRHQRRMIKNKELIENHSS